MNAHLTHEELTDKLLGDSSLTVNAHLLECPGCADELERLKGLISSFRDAAHAWSESNLATVERNSERTERPTRWPAANWILVAAALLLLVAGSTAYLHVQRMAGVATSAQVSTPVVNPGLTQSQLDQDNELLSQVSGELAESVPAPMQPLLVSDSATSSAVTSK
jgi:anti-sigma factor RsiW